MPVLDLTNQTILDAAVLASEQNPADKQLFQSTTGYLLSRLRHQGYKLNREEASKVEKQVFLVLRQTGMIPPDAKLPVDSVWLPSNRPTRS
jgi:hypothetical protein